MPNPSSAAKIIAAVRNTPGNRVKVAVSDIDGVLRGKYLHKEKFYSAAESGFGFCDVVFGWDMMDAVYDNTTVFSAMKGMDVQTIDHAIIILFILIGNIAFFVARAGAKRG